MRHDWNSVRPDRVATTSGAARQAQQVVSLFAQLYASLDGCVCNTAGDLSRKSSRSFASDDGRIVAFDTSTVPPPDSPKLLGSSEVRAFLCWLATDRNVSASTQNQALSAVLFLYREVLRQDLGQIEHVPRARVPGRVPVVLTPAEVRAVLTQLSGVPSLVAALLYGGGLRLQECLELRVKDIDFERREITVRRGKGQNDRRVPLGSDELWCLLRWIASFPMPHRNGYGRSYFRRVGSAAICDSGRHHGSTCTRP